MLRAHRLARAGSLLQASNLFPTVHTCAMHHRRQSQQDQHVWSHLDTDKLTEGGIYPYLPHAEARARRSKATVRVEAEASDCEADEQDGAAPEPESAAAAAEAAEVAEAAAALQAAALEAAKEEMEGWDSNAIASTGALAAGGTPGTHVAPGTPLELGGGIAAPPATPAPDGLGAEEDRASLEAVAARHHKELAQAELLRKASGVQRARASRVAARAHTHTCCCQHPWMQKQRGLLQQQGKQQEAYKKDSWPRAGWFVRGIGWYAVLATRHAHSITRLWTSARLCHAALHAPRSATRRCLHPLCRWPSLLTSWGARRPRRSCTREEQGGAGRRAKCPPLRMCSLDQLFALSPPLPTLNCRQLLAQAAGERRAGAGCLPYTKLTVAWAGAAAFTPPPPTPCGSRCLCCRARAGTPPTLSRRAPGRAGLHGSRVQRVLTLKLACALPSQKLLAHRTQISDEVQFNYYGVGAGDHAVRSSTGAILPPALQAHEIVRLDGLLTDAAMIGVEWGGASVT